jgi:hypothetical protein
MPPALPSYLTIRTDADIDNYMALVRGSAARAREWIIAHDGDALDLLRQMKFHPVGFHPVEDRSLNLIEQLNQTWTYAVALTASRKLLELHPDVGGFMVAPGAHMSIDLDIMSFQEGAVGAETFAATHPGSNGKLVKDRNKLAIRSELNRYVFFSAPRYAETKRQPAFERDGVQVWSVAI